VFLNVGEQWFSHSSSAAPSKFNVIFGIPLVPANFPSVVWLKVRAEAWALAWSWCTIPEPGAASLELELER